MSVTLPTPDYEKLYKELCEHEKLKPENDVNRKELLSLKQSNVNYESGNESLQFNVKNLEEKLKATNLMLKERQRKCPKKYKFSLKPKLKPLK